MKKIQMYAAAVGVAAGALTLSACGDSTPPPPPSPTVPATVNVPEVVGLTLSEATVLLTASGLVLGEIAVAAEGTTPGVVIGQSLGSGAAVPPGSVVDLVVTAEMSTVPVLLSKTQLEAEKAIVAAGYVVGSVRQVASSAPEGQVVAQSPHAGEKLPKGSSVDLRVANGTEGLIDVVGLSQRGAEAALAEQNLKVRVEERAARDPRGTVIEQTPKAGATVKVGSTVTLFVSSGPEPAPTPVALKCDGAQITAAVQAELKKEDKVLDKVNRVKCDPVPSKGEPGWAAAEVITGTDPAFLEETLIFQAKNNKWVYQPQSKACALGSSIPDSIRNFAC